MNVKEKNRKTIPIAALTYNPRTSWLKTKIYHYCSWFCELTLLSWVFLFVCLFGVFHVFTVGWQLELD